MFFPKTSELAKLFTQQSSRRSSAAERGIRNAQVRGSNPRAGSTSHSSLYKISLSTSSHMLEGKHLCEPISIGTKEGGRGRLNPKRCSVASCRRRSFELPKFL